MKYLISESFEYSRIDRAKFIQDAIGLPLFYYKRKVFDKFYLYQSFPFNTEPDVCLIFGHNKEVADLLKNQSELIPEKNIFIITCAINYLSEYNVSNKNIYLCPQTDDGNVRFRNGLDFHLSFIVTDTELFLAQSKENDVLKKFESCFELIYNNVKE